MWIILKTKGAGDVKGGSLEWGGFPIIGHTKLIFQICVGELCYICIVKSVRYGFL